MHASIDPEVAKKQKEAEEEEKRNKLEKQIAETEAVVKAKQSDVRARQVAAIAAGTSDS